ncbi:MAG: choice-of-anchor D domain-containing protein [Hymenobacteraceae bacterium]|nr:choice-of-anchor D domain-containing protein [Hymenobacteraceae bacterium]
MSNLFKSWGPITALTLAAALTGVPSFAQTVDGTRGGAEGYGTALAVQTIGTDFGNSTNGAILYANGGAELDNIHAQIVGSDLFIFIAGNLPDNGNTLDLFIDSKGGGQNPIAGGNNGPAGPYTGMTLDTGIIPDYVLGFTFSGGFLQTQFSILGAAGSNNIGQTNTGGVSFPVDFDLTGGTNLGDVAINNSNTAGVTGGTSSGSAAGAGSVTTGIEIRIPLSAISPTGNINIAAIINGGGRNYISNQTLAGLPSPKGNLGGNGNGGFTGSVTGINFTTFAGDQFVTIPYTPVVVQPDLGLSPTSLRFGSVLTTAGSTTRTFTITNTGNAPLNVTAINTSNPAFTAAPQTVTALGVGLSQTIIVTFNPSLAGAQNATLTVVSDAPIATPNTVSANGIGTAPGTALVDGTRDATYPAALGVQNNATSFGNSTSGDDGNASGSELDNVHTQIIGNDLYIFLGGNLETNGNHLELFFDSKRNVGATVVGQNKLLTGNTGPAGAMTGLQFDAAVNADYAVSVKANANGALDFSYSIIGTTDGGAVGAGTGPITATALDFDLSAGTLAGLGAINNSNTGGVTGSLVGTPGSVDTGIELRIPLSALGTSANNGPIRLTAFVNSANHGFASNQFLASLPASSGHAGNIGSVNLTTVSSNQFVTIPNGVAPLVSDIAVSPPSLSFGNVSVAGSTSTRTFEISNNGDANLVVSNISSSNGDFAVSSTNLTLAPNTDQTITVTFDPSMAGTRNGTLTITSNDPDSPTKTVSVTGVGIAAGQIVIDGTRDALYGAAVVLQNNTTGFGNDQSELDGAYARIANGKLNLLLTGNLQAGGNRIVLFFDNSPKVNSSTFSGAAWPSIGNSDNLNGLQFEPGFTPEYMLSLNTFGSETFADFAQINAGSSSYLGSNGNQILTFPGGSLGGLSVNNTNAGGVNGTSNGSLGTPAAVMTGFELAIPLSAIAPGYSAATPLRVVAFISNPDFNFLSNQVLGGIANGANFNVVNIGNPNGRSFASEYTGNQFFTVQRGDVTVANTELVDLKGDFRKVLVQAGGQLSAIGGIDVSQTLTVQSGGALVLDELTQATVTGTGSFALQGTASLTLANSAGLTTGASGGLQNTGSRSLSSESSYAYITGGTSQTGNALPATVRELIVMGSSARGAAAGVFTLTQNLNVIEAVRCLGTDLTLNGKTLRLLSSIARGTALIENVAGGAVLGSTGQMECALDPSFRGVGYRHYSTPTAGMTIGLLTTSAFTPIVDAAYNSSTPPDYTNATFPNVFSFDESKATNNFAAGYQSPLGLSSAMEVGTGYAVRLTGTPELVFKGTFTSEDQQVTLTRTGNTVNSGWNLIGNMFPSPLDWDLMMIPEGVSSQVSVQSPIAADSANGGVYLTRQNGLGSLTSGWIPAAQGIFVRRTEAGSAPFTLEQAARVTSIAGPTIHYRGLTDTRPMVSMTLGGTGGFAAMIDQAVVYFQAGATPATDDRFDGLRVGASSGDAPTISTRLADGALAQVDGRPVLTGETEIPLVVSVTRPGTYVLTARELRRFTADQPVLLVDALTGTTQDLRTAPAYRFTTTPAATGPRFSLRFGSGRVTGVSTELAAAALSVYPNPSAGNVTVEWTGAEPLAGTVTLTDLLGRTVRTAPAGAARLTFEHLPKGVYSLRVQSTTGPLTRRIVVE